MDRVAIYTRISRVAKESDEPEQSRLAVERQEAECRLHAKKLGLEVVAVKEDNNVSASTSRRRPEWESLLKLAQDGEIEGILVWHPDRLYRRLADLAVLMKVIRERNVKIYTVVAGELDLSSPAGILMAEIMGAVAGHEVRHKAERQVSKAREMAKAGVWSGNRVPLGYRFDPTDKHKLLIHAGEADILRQARRRILAGHGLKDTTRWTMQSIKQLGSERETLTPTNLRNILMSPTHAGYRIYVPQSERDAWNQRRKNGRQKPDDFRYQAQHLFPATWEPIFSDEERKSITALLTNPSRINPGRSPKALLSGVLRCHRCGSTLTYSKTASSIPSYKCSNYTLNCPGLGISAAPIEQLILDSFVRLVRDSPAFAIGSPAIRSLPQYDERDKLKAQEARWLDLYGEEEISRSELHDRLAGVRARLEILNRDEAVQYEQIALSQAINNSVSRWDALTMRDDQGNLGEEQIAELRAVLKASFHKITILPTHKSWGRKFQPLRVVPWWEGSPEPSIEEAIAFLQDAERDQLEKVKARKAAEEARQQLRARKGGLK